jgi:hypothetical protein
VVSAAAQRYRVRRGSPVWSYTHAWRRVPRAAWGGVSILASCESPEQVRRAWERGYAAALVVAHFPQEGAHDLAGVRVLPCPWQSRGVTCRDCRLCWDDTRLLERRLAIGFAAHGSGAARVRWALPVV